MNWLIAGLGFISPRHIEAISNIGDNLIATCDIDPKKLNLKRSPFYTNYSTMLKSQTSANAIAICTPNNLHYLMIKIALNRNLRVLCEKPLTLRSNEIETLPNDGAVGVVLQLRTHPEIIKLKEQKIEKANGSIVVKVYRDQEYWDGWKGHTIISGGILYNLAIHYFDLLIHLFGNEYQILEKNYSDRLATGKIDFDGSIFDYHFEIMNTKEGQDRLLKINGREISLSRQDNLSFESLHSNVYKDFIKGKVVTPTDANKSIKLIEKICLKI